MRRDAAPAVVVALLSALLSVLAAPVAAQDATTLGYGRLFTNDYFGDGRDRWRTGGYQLSIVRGAGWDGTPPDRPGLLLEYRLRSEIIAPSWGAGGTVDRPYAGTLSAGLHSHFGLGPLEAAAGADLTLVGPATGLSDFQEAFHELFSLPRPRGTDSQLGDAAHISGTVELAWPIRATQTVTIRPFVGAQAGVEDLVRFGGDIIVGTIGHRDLLIRDTTTGQLIRAIEGPQRGAAILLGADWAAVGASKFLPEDQGFAARNDRWRARGGVHWQIFPEVSIFYGLTYLGAEFEGQSEGQILGGLKLNFNF